MSLQTILAQCIEKNHRRLVVLAGEKSWAVEQAKKIGGAIEDSHLVWISTDPTIQNRLSPKKFTQALGTETRCVIVDCFDGFYPDSVAALSGCVQGGGVFILLLSSWDSWSSEEDEDNRSRAIHGVDYRHVSDRFKKRMHRIMGSHEGCVVYQQHKINDALLDVDRTELPPSQRGYPTAEQSTAITALKRVSTGHAKRPLVISSDRGRGKSAAMGIAAAQLMRAGSKNIIVTAPRWDSVASLFKHAKQELVALSSTKDQGTESRREEKIATEKMGISYDNGEQGTTEWVSSTLKFIPPDQLLREIDSADLLLVDEAAAIPTSLLNALVVQYSRIAFTTTLHGYEGTGRGFALRFQETLSRLRPQWRHYEMTEPIRWAEDDPLEALMNTVFLLERTRVSRGAETGMLDALDSSLVTVAELDREGLGQDEGCLSSLFRLLTEAHYRTSPSDLRDILDGPNLKLWVLKQNEQVYGVMLVAIEGGFEADMVASVVKGERRPRGHVLPQQLAAQLGYSEALALRSARVVRIAIHPQIQSQRWGSHLISVFEQWAKVQNLDYIGSSFGCTAELIRFWWNSGFEPVRVGFTREASSGHQSLTVVKGLTEQGVSLMQEIGQRFSQQFAHQLTGSLKLLEWDQVFGLLQRMDLPPELSVSEQDLNDVTAFSSSARSFESCGYGLWKVVLNVLSDPDAKKALMEDEIRLLVLLCIQQYDEVAVIQLFRLSGRKSLMKNLRKLSAKLQLDPGLVTGLSSIS
ncbi:MAG: GNAT family N-acetyltransferase [Pseudomonadales bacterium]|nr:GNAT family N-acetyltransferase [Pseudomonadales bacterium]